MADFYLDADVGTGIASLLRSRGHTVVTARDMGLESATDDEHLLTAAQLVRTFVTHNRKDFLLLHGAWRRWSRAWLPQEHALPQHAGILVVHQWPAPRVVTAIHALLIANPPLSNALYRCRFDGRWEHQP